MPDFIEKIKNEKLRNFILCVGQILILPILIPFFLFLIVWLNWLGPIYERITGKEMWNPK